MSELNLSALREEINQIDQELSMLFDRRMQVTNEVALYKHEHGMTVFDQEREQQVIERVESNFPQRDEHFHRALRTLYQTIMDLGKESQMRYLQSEDVIGYQGVPGSFSYEALERFYGMNVEKKNYLNFEDVFTALERDEIRTGVLPVENSSTGIITDVYDLIGQHQFYIQRECTLPVEQNLLGIRESSLDMIREVYSHPQGFAQSAMFFSEHDDWTLTPYYNTAKSAQLVHDMQDPTKACVASKKAAQLYDLITLKENIQDLKENHTRFVVIGKNMMIDESADKITLFFTASHRVGSLARVLDALADRGLNILTLEARPIRGQIWEYSFFMDVEGNAEDPRVIEALQEMKHHCLQLRFLGNYRRQ